MPVRVTALGALLQRATMMRRVKSAADDADDAAVAGVDEIATIVESVAS